MPGCRQVYASQDSTLLELLGVGRDTDQGIRRGIVDVFDALVLIQERMAVGEFADI